MSVYDAFISYSHAKDRPIANALQSVIQRLGKPWYRRRELRVFRDDTSLSATPQLWPTIVQALDQSRFLILLASPEAAASRWVDKEAQHWLAHKSADTFLIALTDGDLVWDDAAGDFAWPSATPIPPSLKGHFSNEPKWVDLRPYRAGANPRDQAFMELAADFAAAVRGIPKEDLLSEELRQQRRALRLAWSAAAAMLLLAVGVGLAGWIAVKQRDRAEQTLAATTESANSMVIDVAAKIRRTVGIPAALTGDILARTRKLQEQLIGEWEANPRLRRSQAIVYRELAQTFLLFGDTKLALENANSSLAIMNVLTAYDPRNSELLRELSRSYNRIGDAYRTAGRASDAAKAYHTGLKIRRDLAAAPTADPEAERDLAYSLERTADSLFALREFDEARELYQENFGLRDKLARTEPDKWERQAELAVAYERVGERVESEPQSQLGYFEESRSIREKLVEKDASDGDLQQHLATSYRQIGRLLMKLGSPDEALDHFQKSLKICERLTASNPEVVAWQTSLVSSLSDIAEAGDRPRERYTQALEILRKLDGKLAAYQEGWAADIAGRLQSLTP